ncbi:MAG: response regulator [bacterium]
MPVNPARAEEMVQKLSHLFRYTLDASNYEYMKLNEEVEFIKDYLEIEKVRLGDRLSYSIELDKKLADFSIPGMLLQPLVENSVKHGIATTKTGGNIQIKCLASNGFEAVEKINTLKPDLIVLDIQMPELTGFEVLERIAQTPFIIFSTAYDQYALKAFETNSIDYLLKPVDPSRLKMALDKLNRLTQNEKSNFQIQLQNLLDGLKTPKTKPNSPSAAITRQNWDFLDLKNS